MRTLILVFLLTISIASFGQLFIGSGAQVQASGAAVLTLKDVNLVNNGSFLTGSSTIYFSGTADTYIGGSQTIQFYNMRVEKGNGRFLMFYRPVAATNEVQFSQGYIDLNSYDLDLGNLGQLVGESATSNIIGPAGGEIIRTATLNAPSAVNPGNLGAQISSSQNLGTVVVRRGHQAQTLSHANSILRYYVISPANNSGLNATLRFHYFDTELNGLTENTLTQWRSVDGVNWTYHGFNTRDVSLNHVEKTGINAFSTWTLSSPSAALPVIFTGFNLQCDDNRVILRWKTAQEYNSSHFVVEKNSGPGWVVIGQLPAAGNSSIEKSYEFVDINTAARAYYRVAQYDIDGTVKYTSTSAADCALKEALLVGPNPFSQSFTVRIHTTRTSAATLKVIDARGALLINRKLNLQTGLNQFEVDLQNAAAGVYLLMMEWSEGGEVKTMRLMKQ